MRTSCVLRFILGGGRPTTTPIRAPRKVRHAAEATVTVTAGPGSPRSGPGPQMAEGEGDLGVPFGYKPTYRPKRLVMPVDPSAPFDSVNYAKSTLLAAAVELEQLKQRAQAQGAVRLGAVPEERTVGDAFAFCLQVTKSNGLLRRGGQGANEGVRSRAIDFNTLVPVATPSEGSYLDSGTDPTAESIGAAGGSAVTRSDQNDHAVAESAHHLLWDLLSRTTLNSPVHGGLSHMGQSLVMDTVAADALFQFPRLRSQHIARLQRLCCGLLPTCVAATTVGLVDVCGVETDVALWRELNHMMLHKRWAEQQLEEHKERELLGMPSSSRPFFERHMSAIRRLLRHFPVQRHELQPRILWLQQLFHCYIGFVAEVEGEDCARNLARRLLCPELSFGRGGSATSAFREVHPLNQRAELRALAAQSTAGRNGAVLCTEVDYRKAVERFPDVPGVVIDAVQSDNALKEAQLILAYDSAIPAHLRDAPIDFQVDFESIDVLDNSNDLAAIDRNEPIRSKLRGYRVSMTLGATRLVIGTGTGDTEKAAMNAAAVHVLQNYYFRRFDAVSTPSVHDADH